MKIMKNQVESPLLRKIIGIKEDRINDEGEIFDPLTMFENHFGELESCTK